MVQLSGGLGYIYSGYKLAITIARWSLTRKPEVLGGQAASGIGIVARTDPFWVTQPLTKVSLRIGTAMWSWDSVVLVSAVDSLIVGGKAEFRVNGEPEVTSVPSVTRFDHR